MKIRGHEVLIPTSMVGNYPNPRWWDASYARHFAGEREPPDSLMREALEDAIGAIVRDQEEAGLDIISDGRVHGDNYAEQALYYSMRRLGYELRGGQLGFPIYSRMHGATLRKPFERHGSIMVEQARALRSLTRKPIKVQYVGLQTLLLCTNDLYYKTPRDRALALPRSTTRSSRSSTRSASTSSRSTSSPGPTSSRTGPSRPSIAPSTA